MLVGVYSAVGKNEANRRKFKGKWWWKIAVCNNGQYEWALVCAFLYSTVVVVADDARRCVSSVTLALIGAHLWFMLLQFGAFDWSDSTFCFTNLWRTQQKQAFKINLLSPRDTCTYELCFHAYRCVQRNSQLTLVLTVVCVCVLLHHPNAHRLYQEERQIFQPSCESCICMCVPVSPLVCVSKCARKRVVLPPNARGQGSLCTLPIISSRPCALACMCAPT